VAERKRVPTTTEEWVGRVEERLRVLENRRAYVIGIPPAAYLIDVNLAGELTATHTTTGTVTVLALP
jgi:hypothetical protein